MFVSELDTNVCVCVGYRCLCLSWIQMFVSELDNYIYVCV
jgi:hypothetical protein